MLTKTGTLIVDLLSTDHTETGNYVWKKFLQLLKSLFPVCVLINLRDRSRDLHGGLEDKVDMGEYRSGIQFTGISV
nr:unnamed protein product [Haemonchus contortus]